MTASIHVSNKKGFQSINQSINQYQLIHTPIIQSYPTMTQVHQLYHLRLLFLMSFLAVGNALLSCNRQRLPISQSQTSPPMIPHDPQFTSTSTSTTPVSSSCLSLARPEQGEDIYAAVHRKEYEMRQVKQVHHKPSDPVIMAMSYAQETPSNMRLAKALRRVYEDDTNPANPNNTAQQQQRQQQNDSSTSTRQERLQDYGLAEMGLRRASFLVDIKRYSRLGQHPHEQYCQFDDAGRVAQAMVQLGADAVLINTDYPSYGGDMTELKSAVKAVRQVSDTAAVVMKDIVVDEIQLGLAKDAGADGIILMASVLGPALDTFLDLATTIGLETIVECHTKAEVERALEIMAPAILVNNYDRVTQTYYENQAQQLAGLFPGSGGPVICLATGGIDSTDSMKKHLSVGYDGVIVGRAVMGSPQAPEFIRAVRDRTLLPAELSAWGLEHVEFDPDGNVMPGPKADVPTMDDPEVYQ